FLLIHWSGAHQHSPLVSVQCHRIEALDDPRVVVIHEFHVPIESYRRIASTLIAHREYTPTGVASHPVSKSERIAEESFIAHKERLALFKSLLSTRRARIFWLVCEAYSAINRISTLLRGHRFQAVRENMVRRSLSSQCLWHG